MKLTCPHCQKSFDYETQQSRAIRARWAKKKATGSPVKAKSVAVVKTEKKAPVADKPTASPFAGIFAKLPSHRVNDGKPF